MASQVLGLLDISHTMQLHRILHSAHTGTVKIKSYGTRSSWTTKLSLQAACPVSRSLPTPDVEFTV